MIVFPEYIGDDNYDGQPQNQNECMPCTYNALMSFALVILIVLAVIYFMIVLIIYYGNKYSIYLLFNLLPSKHFF